MQYKRFNDTYMVRFDKGEEITRSLTALCEAEQIRLAQVDAIGATDHTVIGVFDPKAKAYCQEELDGLMEITGLTGNVTFVNGKPYIHLHTILADENHTVHSGHVIELRVGLTCEMFVRVLEGEVGRQRNEELGINLWKFD